MYLLDSNVVSELRKGPRAHERVRVWNDGISEHDCFLSTVTLFELRLGALLKRQRDPAQGNVLLRWVEAVRSAFAERIVNVSPADWMRCADLHVPDPRPFRDSLIAACALQHDLVVVTRNTTDFAGMGVPVVNPWGG